jgi:hypothetical protein
MFSCFNRDRKKEFFCYSSFIFFSDDANWLRLDIKLSQRSQIDNAGVPNISLDPSFINDLERPYIFKPVTTRYNNLV